MSAVLTLRNVGKAYRRYARHRDRLIEKTLPWFGPRHEPVWVIRNVDLEVQQGESIAIIGQNGAGKSTLLRLVTGTTRPTEGHIQINGRVAAILELGIGFHTEFTGRQNVLIAGQLMGLSPEEVTGAMPEIERFAEIGSYFDQPVRVYSSGMHVRLAFSVATAIRPDILIVDEALAVGDAYFQHKCAGRIRLFKEQGTTLLFVSHDATAVKSLCERALLLDRGLVAMDDEPDRVLDYYNAIIAKREAEYSIRAVEGQIAGQRMTRSGDGRATIDSVDLLDAQGVSTRALRSNAFATIRVTFCIRETLPSITVGFLIRDRLGNDVFGTNTYHLDCPVPTLSMGGRFQCDFEIDRIALGCAHYSVSAALHEGGSHVVQNHDWWDQAVVFQIIRADEPYALGVANLPVKSIGVVRFAETLEHC